MSREHLIHRLSIDIGGLKTNQEYQRIANRLSAIVRTSLSSRLNKLLNELDFNDYHIIIDYLELDLGLLNINNLENSIISKLERQLRNIIPPLKIHIEYKIKHGDFDLFTVDEHTQSNLRYLVEKNLRPFKADVNFNVNLNKNSLSAKVVLPKAMYLDSVVHFLEHGYFSRNLFVSEETFAKVFTKTVLQNQGEILEYFDRKPESTRIKALERFQKQLSSRSVIKSGSQHKKQTQKLLDNLYHDKIQTLVKAIETINIGKAKAHDTNKKILALLETLYPSQKSINKISDTFQKLAQKVSQKLETSKTEESQSSNLLPGDEKVLKFKERLNRLLDERDQSAFNEFLKNPFVKSLSKSYISTIDSVEVLSQALFHLISDPHHRKEVFNALPSYLESEKDLVNQLYKKSPTALRAVLFEIGDTNNSAAFLNGLPKKHLNLVLQSMVSYYSKLAPILNFLNESSTADTQDLKNSHLSQIHLFSNLVKHPDKTTLTIDNFVSQAFDKLDKDSKLTKSKLDQYSKSRSFIKERTYKPHEKILETSIQNVIQQTNKYQKDSSKLAVYQLKTLLNHYYIPFAVKDKKISTTSLDKLISDLAKHQKNKQKDPITELFVGKKILKNSVLRNLSYSNFKAILSLALPTAASRKYVSLFDKYNFIWKNTISQADAQLIFLSLIEKHRDINEATIFKHYYDKLKDFKAWTYDVQRKKIVENYELHRDKLREEVRAVVINYIDDIPTLESMAFKESRKKLEAGIPVKNAGLVLLWPFLKTLFGLCDYLTDKGDFIDSISRERAVLLLQYLAVKSSAVEEPYLALNKILTGFPLNESIANEIILTDKEKDIADALLLNVIRQWPSFQNSSADNLRGSFLIRNGILYFKGGQWVLQVENKSYDLLLSKLPWGFSLIRLSWLTYMLKVEWN